MAVLSSLVNVAYLGIEGDASTSFPGDSLYAVSASGTISSFVLVLGAA